MAKIKINDNVKLIRNGGRKTIPFTTEELKKKIISVAKKNDFYEDCHFDEILFNLCSPDEECIGSKVATDISCVEFDTENVIFNQENYNDGWIGYHQIGNFAFLGCAAGGDWEYPVNFAIYYDGKSLRGYVPRYCNSYNLKTKQAFGNDYDLNLNEEIAAYLGIDAFTEDDVLDNDGLIKDITSRVLVQTISTLKER